MQQMRTPEEREIAQRLYAKWSGILSTWEIEKMIREEASKPEPAPPLLAATEGDEEMPNLHTLRQGVPSEMLSKIQAWARAESCEWPHGTYSPNDFPAFFEKGALWGLRTSRAELMAEVKRGEERLAKIAKHAEVILSALNVADWEVPGECRPGAPPHPTKRALTEIGDLLSLMAMGQALGAGHREGEDGKEKS